MGFGDLMRLLLAFVLTVACSSNATFNTPVDASVGDVPQAGHCTAGQTNACACLGQGNVGVQVCDTISGAFGMCMCPGMADASVDTGQSAVDVPGADVSVDTRVDVPVDLGAPDTGPTCAAPEIVEDGGCVCPIGANGGAIQLCGSTCTNLHADTTCSSCTADCTTAGEHCREASPLWHCAP